MEFLKINYDAVINMLSLQYDQEVERRVLRDEAIAEGKEGGEGIEEGREV